MVNPTILAENLQDQYYTQGQSDNIFLKSFKNKNKDYLGALINTNTNGKKVVFIDWFNDKCVNVWKSGLNSLY